MIELNRIYTNQTVPYLRKSRTFWYTSELLLGPTNTVCVEIRPLTLHTAQVSFEESLINWEH